MSDTHAGVIAPPPLIFLGFLAAGWGLGVAFGLPALGWDEDVRLLTALCFAAPGLMFVVWALGLFRTAKTPARPWLPSSAIVTTGVYRYTRNPMYLGMAMLYAGAAIALDSLGALLGLAPAVVVIDLGVIRREERYLEAKFGADYLRYKAAVRRWI